MLPYASTLVTAQLDGPACTAAARATALPGQALFTLPPNYFDVVGKQLAIRASGRVSSVITTPGSFRLDVNFVDSAGSSAIVWDSMAASLDTQIAHTNAGWVFELLLTCRSVGAAGNLLGQATLVSEALLPAAASSVNLSPSSSNPRSVNIVVLPFNQPPSTSFANFDTTKAQTVDLKFTQVVATGSEMLHQYSLIAPN